MRLAYGTGYLCAVLIYWYVIETKSLEAQNALLTILFGPLFTYGWMALLAYELFFSDFTERFKAKRIQAIPFFRNYVQYQDDLRAYQYWKQIQTIDYWMRLDGHQFEDAVASVFRHFGYDAKVSKRGGDGGIDIVLKKNGQRTAVQCKAHAKPIGPSVARDLLGTMAHLGFNKGIIVSRSGFTAGTRDFVREEPIQLMNLNDILDMCGSNSCSNRAAVSQSIKKKTTEDLPPAETDAYSAPNRKQPSAEASSPRVYLPISSTIQSAQFADDVIYLSFTDGVHYAYYNVPREVFDEFVKSQSLERYFHEVIHGKYPSVPYHD